ncbi:MAG: hypothetical protein ACR2NR_05490 [Solirubrobacteraceae bacterium]
MIEQREELCPLINRWPAATPKLQSVKLLSEDGDEAVVRLSRQELTLLNNALNEVCNGVAIDDFEFATRLGVGREQAREVLQSISNGLPGLGKSQPV